MKKEQHATEPSNTFTRLLAEFRNGESLNELSEKLQKLVQAVRETGKPGQLLYTIVVKPSGDAVIVTDKEPALKLPQVDRDAAIFFATEDNLLVRENPKQRTLDLREVKREEPEVREVAAVAAVVK